MIPEGQTFQYEIEGNKRTANSYIEKLASRCLEKIELDELDQCLVNSKLFSEVKIKRHKDVIQIEVKERWTLIPIPIFGAGGETTRFGMMILESNAFGHGKMVMLGGSVGDDGHLAMMMYKNESVRLTNWTAQLLGTLYKQDQYSYYKKEKLYGYHQDRSSILGGFGYRLSKDLSVALNVGYGHNRFDSGLNVDKPKNFDAIYLVEKIEYKGGRYKFYFEEGINFTLVIAHQAIRDDSSKKLFQPGILIDWQRETWARQVLQVSFEAAYSNLNDIRNSLEEGQKRGFRGTETSSLWLNRYLSLSLDYQIPIKRASYGTWTIAPFMDIARFKSIVDLNGIESLISYGLGGYLFLKNIAIPGVGLELGYNSKFRGEFVNVSIGFSF